MAREHILLNIGPIVELFELDNAIHDVERLQVFEVSNLIPLITRVQFLTPIKYEFMLLQGQNLKQVALVMKEALPRRSLLASMMILLTGA